MIVAMSPEDRTKPRPLEFYRTRLRGRQRRSAQAGEVGEALRSLGYTRKRAWQSESDGFCSLWHPPLTNKNQ
jgi:hypothetical protein